MQERRKMTEGRKEYVMKEGKMEGKVEGRREGRKEGREGKRREFMTIANGWLQHCGGGRR